MAGFSPSNTLYHAVLAITQDYLGPAAVRFLDRSIVNHLHKNPQDLSQDDLDGLIHWLRVSVSFLTEDTEVLDKFSSRLEQLKKATKTTV